MANMRLASGSMFNGIFDVGNALTAPLEATLMGSPYTHKPIQVRIWLRYERGNVFQDRDGKPHHYNSDGSDQLSNDPIHGVTDEWQEFTIPVVYTSEIDATILENKGYSIAFGSASSWQGGYFAGAIGSKLYMDNLHLYCE